MCAAVFGSSRHSRNKSIAFDGSRAINKFSQLCFISFKAVLAVYLFARSHPSVVHYVKIHSRSNKFHRMLDYAPNISPSMCVSRARPLSKTCPREVRPRLPTAPEIVPPRFAPFSSSRGRRRSTKEILRDFSMPRPGRARHTDEHNSCPPRTRRVIYKCTRIVSPSGFCDTRTRSVHAHRRTRTHTHTGTRRTHIYECLFTRRDTVFVFPRASRPPHPASPPCLVRGGGRGAVAVVGA